MSLDLRQIVGLAIGAVLVGLTVLIIINIGLWTLIRKYKKDLGETSIKRTQSNTANVVYGQNVNLHIPMEDNLAYSILKTRNSLQISTADNVAYGRNSQRMSAEVGTIHGQRDDKCLDYDYVT